MKNTRLPKKIHFQTKKSAQFDEKNLCFKGVVSWIALQTNYPMILNAQENWNWTKVVWFGFVKQFIYVKNWRARMPEEFGSIRRFCLSDIRKTWNGVIVELANTICGRRNFQYRLGWEQWGRRAIR